MSVGERVARLSQRAMSIDENKMPFESLKSDYTVDFHEKSSFVPRCTGITKWISLFLSYSE